MKSILTQPTTTIKEKASTLNNNTIESTLKIAVEKQMELNQNSLAKGFLIKEWKQTQNK